MFLNPNFTSTEQECALLHQPDVGLDDDEKETTATSQQAAVREEFVSPTKKRQQQRTTAWATEQNKQFDSGRSLRYNYFSEKRNVCLCAVLLVVFSRCILSALPILRIFPVLSSKIAKEGTKGEMSCLDAPDA